MAGTRKLQAEIDRVLKKIQEGIEEFAQLWDKATTATQPNLKEKYEADLKREIKKLQRHRETVKSFANNSEVKNKKPLLDARRAIEVEMERFKVLEKETKTKAYSKEGLMLALKRSVHKDPSKDPRYPCIVWLNECIEKLREQAEEFDNQIETIREESAGKNKKEDEQIKQLQGWIDSHQQHLERLETALEKLQADEIVFEQVEEIKDGVQYYIESFEDPDYIDDEALYDVLDESPEKIEDRRAARKSQEEQDRFAVEDEEHDGHDDDDTTAQESVTSAATAQSLPVSQAGQERKTADTKRTTTAAATSTTKTEETKTAGTKSQATSGAAATSAAASSSPTGTTGGQGLSATGTTAQPTMTSPSNKTTSPWGQQPAAGAKPMGYSAVVAKANEREVSEPSSASTTYTAAPISTNALPASSPWGTGSAAQLVKGATQVQPLKTSTSVPANAQGMQQGGLQHSASVAPQLATQRSGTSPLQQPQSQTQGAQFHPFPLPASATSGQEGQAGQSPSQPGQTSGAQGHPQAQGGRGVNEVAASPFPSTLPLPNPQIAYLRQLEYGSKMLPDPADVDRSRETQSLSPWNDAPKTFPPRSQSAMFDAAPVYERLSTETLFFIFHEEQSCVRGSGPQLHQFLAGRELRRRGMAFHRAGGVWVTRIVDSLSAMTHQDLQTSLYQGPFPPPTGPSQFVFYFEPTHHWAVVRAETTFSHSSLEDDYGTATHM